MFPTYAPDIIGRLSSYSERSTIRLRLVSSEFRKFKVFAKISNCINRWININFVCVCVIFLKLDVWSAGCVLAELLLGQPIFPGDSGVDQLVEIIKVLGTPTREQIREMNPNYTEFKFPQIKSHPWQKVSYLIPSSSNVLYKESNISRGQALRTRHHHHHHHHIKMSSMQPKKSYKINIPIYKLCQWYEDIIIV